MHESVNRRDGDNTPEMAIRGGFHASSTIRFPAAGQACTMSS
jgi:hypothetical protein